VVPGGDAPGVSRKRSPGPYLPPAPSQARWLRLAEDVIDAAWFRADARRNVLTIARLIGWAADWRTGRSRPTLARLMERSGLSRSSVKRWCRWLEQRGLLAVTEPGTTPQYRPGILYRADGSNLAREWQLAFPADTTEPPSGFSLREIPTQAPAREENTHKDRRTAADSTPPPSLPRLPTWPSNLNPQRRRERLRAAEQLRRDLPVLRRMSARAVRSALRVYFRAGWTVLDVRHALEVRPDGIRHLQTTAIHSPARWLAHRLSYWLSTDGTPIPPHGAELAARAERHQAEQDARREQLAAIRAQAGDYPAQASRAREMLIQARKARKFPGPSCTRAAPPR
jgi:IclR helix-turn-helix domain